MLEAAIAEIERLDPALNAVVMRNYEKAREDADARRPRAPLAGVPFPAKDVNVHVAGFPTTYACRFFADAPAQAADSLLVSRWRAAGMVVPVRTNTPEFATEFVCEPELYGPTANPWDRTRTPGGSSGGAAAAVASGMVPMAHATDSGGSIRVPAGCCGVFGFKPSSGLVAVGSEFGPLVGRAQLRPRDHLDGARLRRPARRHRRTGDPARRLPGPARRLVPRGARPVRRRAANRCRRRSRPSGRAPAGEIADKVEATASTAGPISATRFDHGPGRSTDDVCDGASVFWAGELAAVVAGARGGRSDVDREPESWDRWSPGAWSTPPSGRHRVMQARRTIRDWQVRMADAMADVDVLLTPVTAEPR